MKPSTTITAILGAMFMSGVTALAQVWNLPTELVGAVGTIIASIPVITERLKKGN